MMTLGCFQIIQMTCTLINRNQSQKRDQIQHLKRDIQKLQLVDQNKTHLTKDLKQQTPCLKDQLCNQLSAKKINIFKV